MLKRRRGPPPPSSQTAADRQAATNPQAERDRREANVSAVATAPLYSQTATDRQTSAVSPVVATPLCSHKATDRQTAPLSTIAAAPLCSGVFAGCSSDSEAECAAALDACDDLCRRTPTPGEFCQNVCVTMCLPLQQLDCRVQQ